MKTTAQHTVVVLVALWLLWPAATLHPAQADQDIVVPPPTSALGEPVGLQLPNQTDFLPLNISESSDDGLVHEVLKRGLALLPGPVLGEAGYRLIAGHSSGPASFGPYHSALATLNTAREGDVIRIRTSTGMGVYTIWKKEIVWPKEVDRIPTEEASGITLVTCWPTGTNLKRLLVHARLDHIEPL